MNDIVPVESGITASTEQILKLAADMMTECRNQIAECAQMQRIMAEHIEALEREMKRSQPITSLQNREIVKAVKARSIALLEKKGVSDAKAVTAVSKMIKKALFIRYGIDRTNDLPKCEFEVAVRFIELWDDSVEVRRIVKKYRDSTPDP